MRLDTSLSPGYMCDLGTRSCKFPNRVKVSRIYISRLVIPNDQSSTQKFTCFDYPKLNEPKSQTRQKVVLGFRGRDQVLGQKAWLRFGG